MSTYTYKYKELKNAVKNLKREYNRIDDESDKQLIEILMLGCEAEMNKLKEEREKNNEIKRCERRKEKEERKKNNEIKRCERCEHRKEERKQKFNPPQHEKSVFTSIIPYFIGFAAGAGLMLSTKYLIERFKK